MKLKEIEGVETGIEVVSEKVHQAYCEQYRKKHGKDYWTGGDYSKLDEETKEFDRATIRAVLDNIDIGLDVGKVAKIIGDVDYEQFGCKITHGELHKLQAQALADNFSEMVEVRK